jgi:cellulose synthase/poly-beta-1,6-N-acetylglucosamine synthase-like glycosyltransferase
MVISLAIVLLFIALIPYIIYLAGISFKNKSGNLVIPEIYPNISIIMSAYNEEHVIEKRIANIKACHYPQERYEIIFIDDCSSDNTLHLAETCLEQSGTHYQIIANNQRLGTNRSYNFAIAKAHYPIIVTTDADVFFEPDALKYLIGTLMSDPTIAAVTGELVPMRNTNSTTLMEEVYRSFYGRMCDWESARDSTYNFNGGLVAFRSDLIRRINDKRGSDDANTAFEAIRRGYRAVYVSKAVVYEEIPAHFSVQYRQKIRRATRLIEATLSNLDLLGKNNRFSRFFYPLRIFMYLCTPLLFFFSTALLLYGLYQYNPLFFLLVMLFVLALGVIRKQNLVFAFIVSQFYLVAGLLHLGKDVRVWESTSDKK